MCDEGCAIIPPLLLGYYEAKIQMLSLLSWRPALEMSRCVKIQIFLFLRVRSLISVKLPKLWRHNFTKFDQIWKMSTLTIQI